jgi:exo-beta-1,3-glucanase (GH17 family)/cellulose synthase/poly-beta-1,6-N-acetylglucosamine synthase-like glycosyltransferase
MSNEFLRPVRRSMRAVLGSRMVRALAIALLVALANFGFWALTHRPAVAPDVPQQVAGLSYTPFQRQDDPAAGRFPSSADVDADLALVSKLSSKIRAYTSAQFPELPALAAKHGLTLTAGVWLDGDASRDVVELSSGLEAAKIHQNINRLVVGNETLLKKVLTRDTLIAYLKQARASSRVPVSTAEPWHVWLAQPELAEHVDFITIHLLPYWEGIDVSGAMAHALYQYHEVTKKFPNKPVLIGEVGWPSQGDRFGGAVANPANQAIFLRQFLAAAQVQNLDYFVMEASDQPWKVSEEGHAGAYWGMMDATRQVKFSFSGPIEKDPYWRLKATVSSLLGFALLMLCLTRISGMRVVAQISFAIACQLIMTGAVVLVTQPLTAYLRGTDWVALVVFVPTLVVMILILLAHAFEFSELFWRGSLRRTFKPLEARGTEDEPFVSIHLACCNEPPDMVIATIASLTRLNYRQFEVIVVDNNTSDPRLWKPVAAYVASLPEHFRFIHLPKWPGYKAGALNYALRNTHASAQIIGVVDADYVVRPEWLSALVGYFRDPNVGIVQLPQAHREWGGQIFRKMMNWEYDGFFRIGMHHRNERDAIIQHGTMTLIQAEALRQHGAWSEWCVCEDAELGLRLMKQGFSTVYVDKVLGQGLTPDGFGAFKKQRYRWAQGGMQIFKAHAAALLRGARGKLSMQDARDDREAVAPRNEVGRSVKKLSAGQRYHFLAGWLPWLGDALHLVFALAAIAWSIGAAFAPRWITLPTVLFMVPLATFVLAKLIIGPLLYWRRVPCSFLDIAGASLAGMGVSHGIARGVIAGLFGRKAHFLVTDKGSIGSGVDPEGHSDMVKRKVLGVWKPVTEESLMLAALLGVAALLAWTASQTAIGLRFETLLWISMLLVQALPYAAALICLKLSLRPERRVAISAVVS